MTASQLPRILVVDDDAIVRRTICQVLQHAGYDVVGARDAEQALLEVDDEMVDLVLSDINMPGLSGLDLLNHLHSNRMDCEVILMTGYATVDTAIQALRDGAFEYLTKPISKEALLDALTRAHEKLLQKRHRREALLLMESGLKQFMGQEEPAAEAPAAEAPAPAEPAPRGETHFEVGPVVLDLERFTIEVNGQSVGATRTEIELFRFLCRNPNRVLSPQEILRNIRGLSLELPEASELLRPHISNLRRKLRAAGTEADVIVTVRGMGYMLQSPSDS